MQIYEQHKEGQGESFGGYGGKQRDKEWGAAFFASVFINETTCSQGPAPWAGRERQGAEWSPHNSWGNGQWIAMKLSPT